MGQKRLSANCLDAHCDNYRPHPKDGEDTIFTGVCLPTPGGVPQFQVLSHVSGPRSFLHSTPVPDEGYPRTGVPLARTRVGYPPSRTGVFSPSQERTGVSAPPPETEQQSKHLLRGGRYASCSHAGGLSCCQ